MTIIILLVVFTLLSGIQLGASVLQHSQKKKLETQRIEAIQSVALAIERTKFDPGEFIIMKRYINALLRGLEQHENVLSDVLAGNDAAKEKVKMEFDAIVREGMKGVVRYDD